MSGREPFPADPVTYEEYLLDPPASVWEGLLKADHAAWLGVQSMDVMRAAEERTRAFGRDLTREAWLGLYSPASQLCGQAPDGMAVPHSIFQRAERVGEWKALRSSIGCDEIAAAFGAAHFARELITKLPPEVRQKLQEAQRARDALSDVQARREALQAAANASHVAAPHPPAEATVPGKPPAPDLMQRDGWGRTQFADSVCRSADPRGADTHCHHHIRRPNGYSSGGPSGRLHPGPDHRHQPGRGRPRNPCRRWIPGRWRPRRVACRLGRKRAVQPT